jgi:hypothetical protein
MKSFTTICLILFSLSNLSSRDIDYSKVPTAIKINGQWTLPRGGTIDRLLKKGYMINPEHPCSLMPNPQHPKYAELIRSLKPRYNPSMGFAPKDKKNFLTQMGSSGYVFRLEKDYVWILMGDTYVKLVKDGKNISVYGHRNMNASPFDEHEIVK